MKKNLLLLVVIGFFVVLGVSALKQSGSNLANNSEDSDFYADEQLGAQAGCTTGMYPTISNVQVSGVTSNGAVLTWTTALPANTIAKVWMSPATAGTTPWLPTLDAQGVTSHTYMLTGLTANTQYYYRVRSESTAGGCRRTSSTYTFTTTMGGGTTAPTTPTGLSASNLSCNSLTLNWTASPNATGYETYGPNGPCSVNASAGYCGSTTGATSINITGLSPSTTYTGTTGTTAGFTVLAYNSYGYSSAAPRLAVTTPACQSTDTTAPTTSTAAPASSWANTNIARTLLCTDNAGGSGCGTTYWQFTQGNCPVAGTGYSTGTAASTTSEGQWNLCYYSNDLAGNLETPPKYQGLYKLDHTAPTGSITAPTAGATVTGTYTFAASASDALSGVASVAFKVDGTSVGSDTASPYTYGWNSASVSNGSHTISATITDVAGNTYTTTTIGITVNNGTVNQAPTATISSPTTQATYATSINTVSLGGSASDDSAVSSVTWANQTTGTSGTATGTTSWSIPTVGLASGANTIVVTAHDAPGLTGSDTITVTYTPVNGAPSVTITTPTTATTYTSTSSTVALGGTAADDVGVTSVTWANQTNGTSGTATGTSSWSIATITLSNGSNTLVVTSHDAGGLTGTDTITVTYNAPPVISNVTATSITTSGATITWTTNISADTQVYYGTTTSYGTQSTLNTSLVTAHSVTLSGLAASTTYHYQARSSGAVSSDMSFTTLAANYSWSGGLGLDIGTTLTPSNNEPSGLTWSGGNIFSISDGGVLSKITPTGTLLNTWTLAGAPDAEAVSTTSVNSNVYISYENVPAQTASNPELHEFNPSTGALTGKYWTLSGMTVGANAGMEAITWVPNGHSPYTGTSGGVFYAATENASARVYVFNIDLSTSGGTVSPMTSFVAATDGRYINDLYYASDSRTLYVISNGANKLKALNITSTSPTTISDQTIPAEGVGQEGFTVEPSCPSTTTTAYIAEDTGGTNHIVHKYTNFPVTCNTADTTAPTVSITVPTNGITVTANPIAISGTAADNVAVASVKYAVNSGTQSTATGTTSWSGSATLAVGANTISVIAYDTAGNASTTATVNVTFTPADTTPPVISNVSITSIGQTTATVNWTTDENANGYVDYGIGNYNSTASNTSYSLPHSITLSGLTAGSVYQYKIRSSDVAGNQATYTSPTTFTTSPAGGGAWMPDHTVVVVMENKTANEITSAVAPYIVNTLRPQGRYFSNFYGVVTAALGNAHTSQTQYLHLFYGSNLGVTSNTTCLTTPQTAQNIGAELLAAGKTWNWYSESMGTSAASRAITNCLTTGNYQRKHNPAPNSIGTGVNQYDVSHNLDYSTFTSTSFASLPQVSFITPNMCNDMHDCSITTGDTWLQNNFDSYIQWAKTNNSLFVLYFDESSPSGAASDKFYTLMIGPSGHVVPNSTESATLNHYSMLRFLEDTYGSSTHAGGAATATTFSLQ